VLHHVPKEVLLTPTAEHASRKQGRRPFIASTYEAGLVTGFGKLSHFPNTYGIFPRTNQTFLFSKAHGHDFTAWHSHFMLTKTIIRPIFFWMLMVGHAGNAMILPHLTEEGRAVSFPVENHNKAAKMRIPMMSATYYD